MKQFFKALAISLLPCVSLYLYVDYVHRDLAQWPTSSVVAFVIASVVGGVMLFFGEWRDSLEKSV